MRADDHFMTLGVRQGVQFMRASTKPSIFYYTINLHLLTTFVRSSALFETA